MLNCLPGGLLIDLQAPALHASHHWIPVPVLSPSSFPLMPAVPLPSFAQREGVGRDGCAQPCLGTFCGHEHLLGTSHPVREGFSVWCPALPLPIHIYFQSRSLSAPIHPKYFSFLPSLRLGDSPGTQLDMMIHQSLPSHSERLEPYFFRPSWALRVWTSHILFRNTSP